MATMRLTEGSPSNSRIYWTFPIRQKLAKATAETLIAWNQSLSPPNAVMRKALVTVQPIMLEPHLHRNIPPLIRMSWFRPMVLAEIVRLTTQSAESRHVISIAVPVEVQPDTSSLHTRKHPPIIAADDLGLVLDALTGMDQKLDEFLVTQRKYEEVLTTLIRTVRSLDAEVKGITEGRERLKATPITPPLIASQMVIKPVKIAVVGLEIGNQRRRIEDAVRNFTANLSLSFPDDNRSPANIPYFDQLIVLERLVQTRWQKTAEHLYGGRIHYVKGLGATINLIQKFGQNPEKYRVK